MSASTARSISKEEIIECVEQMKAFINNDSVNDVTYTFSKALNDSDIKYIEKIINNIVDVYDGSDVLVGKTVGIGNCPWLYSTAEINKLNQLKEWGLEQHYVHPHANIVNVRRVDWEFKPPASLSSDDLKDLQNEILNDIDEIIKTIE